VITDVSSGDNSIQRSISGISISILSCVRLRPTGSVSILEKVHMRASAQPCTSALKSLIDTCGLNVGRAKLLMITCFGLSEVKPRAKLEHRRRDEGMLLMALPFHSSDTPGTHLVQFRFRVLPATMILPVHGSNSLQTRPNVYSPRHKALRLINESRAVIQVC
jgi:hypothetical protein